jgi:carbon-monoxide dehydrogenase small subunit
MKNVRRSQEHREDEANRDLWPLSRGAGNKAFEQLKHVSFRILATSIKAHTRDICLWSHMKHQGGGKRMAVRKGKALKKKSIERGSISLRVNGRTYEIDVGTGPDQVEPAQTLAYTLRERLGLTGTKVSCDNGACGCCTVLMDEKAVLSCMTLTIECDGKQITTIEGLKDPRTGTLDPLQQAFIDHTAFQCGFCTPGMIMSAKALLNDNPSPTEEEVKEGLSGNFCRCISHYHVVKAVMAASEKGR